MLFKRIFSSFLLFFALFCIFGCSKESDGRDVIAVSIEPQRAILEKIAGDRFRIVTIMPGGENPETFEPTPSKRIDIEDSKIYFSTGLLPFEQKLGKISSDKSKFSNTSEGIELIYGTHSHGTGDKAHTHSVADPHVWTSIRNVKKIAANMMAALVKADPENASFYKDNFDAYSARLDSLDAAFAKRLTEGGAKAFLVWHPSLSYFARDYGLQQVAVSSETKELSVNSLADVVEKAKGDSIKVMFFQREYDNRQAEMIGKSSATRLVAVSPSAYEWENELTLIVDELAKH